MLSVLLRSGCVRCEQRRRRAMISALGDLLDLDGAGPMSVSRLKMQRERDDAEHRADDRRPAARQARAADHDRGDGVELESLTAHRRRARRAGPTAGPRRCRRTDPAQDVHAEARSAWDLHAGDAGRLTVAADRDDVAAVGGAVEQDPPDRRSRRRTRSPRTGCRAPRRCRTSRGRCRGRQQEIGVLSLIQSASPRAMVNMASVAMNGTTRP